RNVRLHREDDVRFLVRLGGEHVVVRFHAERDARIDVERANMGAYGVIVRTRTIHDRDIARSGRVVCNLCKCRRDGPRGPNQQAHCKQRSLYALHNPQPLLCRHGTLSPAERVPTTSPADSMPVASIACEIGATWGQATHSTLLRGLAPVAGIHAAAY